MITRKLHIISCDNPDYIHNKQSNYSYAFRRLYKMLDESADKNFITKFKTTFNLNEIEYRSLLSQVKSFRNREIIQTQQKQERIVLLQDQICNNTSLSKRKKYKYYKSIFKLKKGLGKESTFGGRALQQRLTIECNKKGIERDENKIHELKTKLKNKRIMPFCIMGEANQRGNRFFDISGILTDGYVVYKPNKTTRIKLQVKTPKKYHNEINLLNGLILAKDIPLTVMLSNEYLYLTYDEEYLHGYGVNVKQRNEEVREIKKRGYSKEYQTAVINEVYKKYYDDQRKKRQMGKVVNRVCAIDMNPEYIGYSILDKSCSGVKVVHCGLICFSRLMCKTNKSSDSAESKYRNNKHRYEVTMAAKRLMDIVNHYGCSGFIKEELVFKIDGDDKSTETNRKIRNIWYRNLFTNCITRRCNESGVELIEVNPCYSSFIGNICYGYADATNASIEIGRRGLYKYEKGGFYPVITEDDIRTLEAKFGDVVGYSTICNWVNIYKSLVQQYKPAEFAQRLRTGINEVEIPYESFSIWSYKSKVDMYTFH